MADLGNFLGYESASLEEAIFSVIPAPLEETADYVRGQALAPQKIIDASSQIEDFDEETGLSIIDLGVHCLAPEGLPSGAALKNWVADQVTAALDATAVPVIIGGEGGITFSAIKALLPKVDELSVLHIDANADLNEADGEENHHTVMRQVLELTPTPHICQVGVRSLSKSAFDIIVDGGYPVECFFMSDINRADDESWQEDVIDELRSPVYLSIDLTGLDPSVIPAVGNPQPGGLGWWQVLRLIKKVASRRRIAAIDITELCPRETDINSDYAAARLVYKAMNYVYAGGKMLEKAAAEAAETEAK